MDEEVIAYFKFIGVGRSRGGVDERLDWLNI